MNMGIYELTCHCVTKEPHDHCPLTEKTNGAPALKGGVPSYDNHEDT